MGFGIEDLRYFLIQRDLAWMIACCSRLVLGGWQKMTSL